MHPPFLVSIPYTIVTKRKELQNCHPSTILSHSQDLCFPFSPLQLISNSLVIYTSGRAKNKKYKDQCKAIFSYNFCSFQK